MSAQSREHSANYKIPRLHVYHIHIQSKNHSLLRNATSLASWFELLMLSAKQVAHHP